MYRTVGEVFASYPRRFNRSKARGLSSVIHLDFTEDDSGQWTLIINEAGVKVREGFLKESQVEEPEIRITCRGQDWVELSNDRLSGMGLMMAGQLRIVGPLRKLVRIQNLLEPEGETSGADE